MSSPDDIESALGAQLLTLGLANVAWENKRFDDPSASWVRPTFLPGNPVGIEMGNGPGSERHVGLYQVDIFTPLDGGNGAARALAQQILGTFPKGATLTFNGTPVGIARSYRLPGYRDPEAPYYVIPVRVEYYTNI